MSLLAPLLAVTGIASAFNAHENRQAQKEANDANVRMQQGANEINLKIMRETNALNKALTEQGWARDDNAVQRRVADLKASGLSPVLAAGSAAGNSAPIRANGTTVTAPEVSSVYNSMVQDTLNSVSNMAIAYQSIQAIKNNAIQMENLQSVTKLNNVKSALMSKELGYYDKMKNLEYETGLNHNKLLKYDVDFYAYKKIAGVLNQFFGMRKLPALHSLQLNSRDF